MAEPRILCGRGWTALRRRYFHVGLLFGGLLGVAVFLGMIVIGAESYRRSLHLAEHYERMAGPILLCVVASLLLTAGATAYLWAWDRWQLKRALRRAELDDGEVALAIAPAYVGDVPRPVLMRMGTFGEFVILTDRRLLDLKWGFMGFACTQKVLLCADQRAALAERDAADSAGVLRSELLRWLGLGPFFTLAPVGEVEAFHLVPEVGSAELLREALQSGGFLVDPPAEAVT